MKASSFGLPRASLAIAAAYLAAHLLFLSPSLEDVDSINFALGLRDFSPSQHQPHPPGYPVYIALGRVSLAVVNAAWPGMPTVDAEALALAVWSALGGACAIAAAAYAYAVWGAWAGLRSGAAMWAAALLAASPLFWMTGLRPMSDMPGLAAALAAQALTLRGMTDRRRLVLAALVAGLAAGLRVQTLLLTVPLLALAIATHWKAGAVWLARPVAAFVGGSLLWAIPLLVAGGGLESYLIALWTQAGEDLSWVNMLWMEPTPRRLAFALYETLALPWASIPLAAAVGVAALVGLAITAVRDRRALLVIALAFAPYAIFHLLFQETIFVRYALPILVAVSWLAVRGVFAAWRFAPALAAPLIVASLVVAVPASVSYGREAHPAFRAIADAATRAHGGPPAAVFAHYSLWRPLQAEDGGLPVVEPRRQYEWLGPVEYWARGGTGPVWFLADPRRTDLALIDPQSLTDVTRYRWSVEGRPELSGTRPSGADWYRIAPPGWFAGEGWSLTPEAGGLTQATNAGPGHRPIEAWVRRREGAVHLVIGGRHLGGPSDAPAEFELAIDGVVRDRWTLTQEGGNFLRFLELPEGLAGSGDYAQLTVRARDGADAEGTPNVAVRQFDIQSAQQLIVGFGEGWHEDEFDLPTGRRWRWTSERSVLQVQGPPQAVRIRMRGESPLRYGDAPPTVRVTAAGRVIAELQPADDFEWTVTVPAEDVARARGAIAIETDRVYLPGEAEGTSDGRRLGLRLWECVVTPVLP